MVSSVIPGRRECGQGPQMHFPTPRKSQKEIEKQCMLRNLKNDTEAGTAATYMMTLKATCVLCMLY